MSDYYGPTNNDAEAVHDAAHERRDTIHPAMAHYLLAPEDVAQHMVAYHPDTDIDGEQILTELARRGWHSATITQTGGGVATLECGPVAVGVGYFAGPDDTLPRFHPAELSISVLDEDTDEGSDYMLTDVRTPADVAYEVDRALWWADNGDRIQEAMQAGQEAFWRAVAGVLDDAETGDLAPEAVRDFDAAVAVVVRQWVEENCNLPRPGVVR